MSYPLLRQWQQSPPPGGWGVSIQILGQTFEFLDGSPAQIVQKVFDIAAKNGVMSNIDQAWSYCNDLWCAKDPGRCLKPSDSEAKPRAPRRIRSKSHMLTTPEQYGPNIWLWLNTYGMRGMFEKQSWAATISRVTMMLDPKLNRATGCSKCSSEWRRLIQERPPADISTSQQAAEWVFWAHNQVNRKIGKKQRDWATMVVENAWDIVL